MTQFARIIEQEDFQRLEGMGELKYEKAEKLIYPAKITIDGEKEEADIGGITVDVPPTTFSYKSSKHLIYSKNIRDFFATPKFVQDRKTDEMIDVARHLNSEEEIAIWLLPHDDDAAIPGAILLQMLKEQGVDSYIIIASQGQRGYSNLYLKDRIAEVRKDETLNAYKTLGVPKGNVTWLNFDDSSLESQVYSWEHPKYAGAGFVPQIVNLLRRTAKDKRVRLFLPNKDSIHPDHQAVYRAGLYAALQAQVDIWPELGNPIEIPSILVCPVWSPTKKPLTHFIDADEKYLNTKLGALACYESQEGVIEGMLEEIRTTRGPKEYFLEYKIESFPRKQDNQPWEIVRG